MQATTCHLAKSTTTRPRPKTCYSWRRRPRSSRSGSPGFWSASKSQATKRPPRWQPTRQKPRASAAPTEAGPGFLPRSPCGRHTKARSNPRQPLFRGTTRNESMKATFAPFSSCSEPTRGLFVLRTSRRHFQTRRLFFLPPSGLWTLTAEKVSLSLFAPLRQEYKRVYLNIAPCSCDTRRPTPRPPKILSLTLQLFSFFFNSTNPRVVWVEALKTLFQFSHSNLVRCHILKRNKRKEVHLTLRL